MGSQDSAAPRGHGIWPGQAKTGAVVVPLPTAVTDGHALVLRAVNVAMPLLVGVGRARERPWPATPKVG